MGSKPMPSLHFRADGPGPGRCWAEFAYHAKLKNFIKAFPGSEWFPQKKMWGVPKELTDVIERRAATYGISSIFGGEDAPSPPADAAQILARLYEPQQTAIYRALADGRFLFNDDTGLGKTAQSITTARLAGAERILVVAPAIMRLSWVEELAKWWPEHPNVGVISLGRGRTSGVSKKAAAARDKAFASDIQIVSYNLVPHIETARWDCVVFDEAHRLCNPASAQSLQCQTLVQHNPGALIHGLTATAMPDRPQNAFGILHALWPGRWGKLVANGRYSFDFNYRYTVGSRNQYGWQWDGVNELHAAELRARLACVSSRTTKDDVLHLLPPFRIIPRRVEPRLLLSQSRDRIRRQLDLGDAAGIERALAAPEDKLQMAEAWAYEAMQSDTHVVLLTKLKSTAYCLANRLGAECVTGDTPADERNKLLNVYRNARNVVLVATMESVHEGIDLTFGTRVAIVELPFRPVVLEQVLGRFWRFSGHKPVTVELLLLAGTVDDLIAARLAHKIDSINQTSTKEGATMRRLQDVLDNPEDDDAIIRGLQEAASSMEW